MSKFVQFFFSWMTLKVVRVVLIVLVLTLVVAPVMAQEATAEPPAPTLFPEVPTADESGALLMAFIIGLIGPIAGSPPGVAFVNFLKRLPFLQNVSGETLKYTVGALLMAAVLIARHLSLEAQFDSGLTFAETLITAVTALLTSMQSMTRTYNAARAGEWPLLGYHRS